MSRQLLRSLFFVAEPIVVVGLYLGARGVWRDMAQGSGMVLVWMFLPAFLALPFLSVSLQRTDRWLSVLGVGTFLLGLVVMAVPG